MSGEGWIERLDAGTGRGPELVATSLAVIHDGQAPGGAFLASPTFGQYRYAWLRDGAFIAEAMDLVGRLDAASRFHRWVAQVAHASAAGMERASAAARAGRVPLVDDYLHCRYDVSGAHGDRDWPTFQLDGPGIWLWSVAHHLRHGGRPSDDVRDAAAKVARYLAALWRTPCSDAWEESPDHVHTSTLAAIATGLGAAEEVHERVAGDAPIAEARQAIAEHLASGTGAYTKWEGSDSVDASLLWMVAPYGLVTPREERFSATLARIERELVSVDGGVHRYPGDTYYGGGEWILLTAALGRVLLRRGGPGDRSRAEAALRWIEAQADERGWLPEQVATNALAPGRIREWRARWGESARPLLWSHAAYLALRAELAALPGA